jgi:hypothetical protein
MVLCQPPDDAQVRHYRPEDAGFQPALCLLKPASHGGGLFGIICYGARDLTS